MMKLLPLVGVVGVGMAYFTGALGSRGYARDVGRPQAEVMAALEDLDITAQPGAPGSSATAAGGIKPVFRLEKAADRMTWYVMSGDKVATRMTAHFEPTADGRQTHITASVERGDAPDDFVSPVFRSEGLTLGLFSMALEGELNDLVAVANGDPAVCQKIMEQFESANWAANARQGDGLIAAVGGTAKTAMRIQAFEAELRRNGCPTGGKGNFADAGPRPAELRPAEIAAPTPGDLTRPSLDPAPALDIPRN